MIKKTISLIIIVLLLFSSCKEEKSFEHTPYNTNVHEIKISNSKLLKASFADYMKDFDYLELKTNTDNYVSEISKVQQFKDNFYVLDSKKSNLYVFDKNGNFIRKIGQRGDGPGEYKDISDYVINTEKETISILSNLNIKIFEYDLQGKFIKDIAFSDFFPKHMNLLNNNYYALYTDNSSDSFKDLAYVNLSGEIVKEDFAYPEDIFDMGFAFTGGISKIGNRFLYAQSSSPKIYEIDNNLKHKAVYNIDLGTKAWKEEDKFEIDRFNRELGKLEISFLNNNFFINNELLYFNYTDGAKLKRGFYNITNSNIYSTDSFTSDGLNLIFYNYVGIDSKNKNIVAYTPEYYKENSNHFKGLDEALKKLNNELFQKFKNADENSNQYLLFFNLFF